MDLKQVLEGEWTHAAAKAVYVALLENRDAFDQRRKGAEFKQMLLALAFSFPEDRDRIYAYLGENPEARNKPSGRAKVSRPPIRAKATKRKGGDCVGCPEYTEIVANEPANRTVKVGGLLTAEDVLERYDGDVTLMTAYAQNQGIDLGKATKPETIADKIAQHHVAQALKRTENAG